MIHVALGLFLLAQTVSLPPADALTAAPWRGAPLGAAQVGGQCIACVGVDAVGAALAFVPVVGLFCSVPLACASPALYGLAATAVGNKLSDREAPVVWPIVTAYAGALVTTLAALGAYVLGFVIVGGSFAAGFSLANPAALLGVPFAIGFGVGAVGFIATAIGVAWVWGANAVPKRDPDGFRLASLDVNAPFCGDQASMPIDTPTPPRPEAPARLDAPSPRKPPPVPAGGYRF
jgi:hypothetical protein